MTGSSPRRIPLSDISYGPEEEAAVLRVLAGRWLSSGPEVAAFEAEFSSFTGAKHAFAVANGTAALHLAYVALGLKDGDDVIQPAINFVASANICVAAGARPVLADVIALGEPTIAPAELERLITPTSKAVVVMHYGGYPCRMREIAAICRARDLLLIEDACHALGARLEPDGAMAGTMGDVGCFSFFANKNLVTGEGGMVVTNRDDVAEKLRLLRSHGMTSMSWDRHRGHASSYDVMLHGYNYRLDELHAAIGRAQLDKLPEHNRRRAELVRLYREGLHDLSGWVVPWIDHAGDSAYHLMTLVAPDPETRERTTGKLAAAGIQTSLHYPCIADFTAFAQMEHGDLPVSRAFASRVITLPLWAGLTEPQVEEIVSIIRDCAG